MPITRDAVALDLAYARDAAYRREADVRRRFTDLLTPAPDEADEPATFTPMAVEELLAAQTDRRPWQQVRRVMTHDGRDIVDAVHEVRCDLLRRLVDHPDTRSTSPVTTAAQVDRDAVRRFLHTTQAVQRLSDTDAQ